MWEIPSYLNTLFGKTAKYFLFSCPPREAEALALCYSLQIISSLTKTSKLTSFSREAGSDIEVFWRLFVIICFTLVNANGDKRSFSHQSFGFEQQLIGIHEVCTDFVQAHVMRNYIHTTYYLIHNSIYWAGEVDGIGLPPSV